MYICFYIFISHVLLELLQLIFHRLPLEGSLVLKKVKFLPVEVLVSPNCPYLSLQMLWGLFKDPGVKLVGHAVGRVEDHADVGNPHNLMTDDFVVGIHFMIVIVKVVIAWFIPEGIFSHEALDGDEHGLEGEGGGPAGPAPGAQDRQADLRRESDKTVTRH